MIPLVPSPLQQPTLHCLQYLSTTIHLQVSLTPPPVTFDKRRILPIQQTSSLHSSRIIHTYRLPLPAKLSQMHHHSRIKGPMAPRATTPPHPCPARVRTLQLLYTTSPPVVVLLKDRPHHTQEITWIIFNSAIISSLIHTNGLPIHRSIHILSHSLSDFDQTMHTNHHALAML